MQKFCWSELICYQVLGFKEYKAGELRCRITSDIVAEYCATHDAPCYGFVYKII